VQVTPQVRAIVFDFDGLLMDTESTSFLSWQWEWSQWGLTLDAADFFVNHGGDVTADRYAALAAAVGAGYDRAASHRRRFAYREKLQEQLGLGLGLQAGSRRVSAGPLAVVTERRGGGRGHGTRSSGCAGGRDALDQLRPPTGATAGS
jgi:beta-phosphoglucomutase-like phosphatase (HAD superfamily)